MADVASLCKEAWLTELRKQKGWIEHAFAQVPDEKIHSRALANVNPPSVIIKHVGGSLRSRFTDFLTSDGEKDWRDRDSELTPGSESRAELLDIWEQGWTVTLEAIEALSQADMARTVTIRSEPMSVPIAITRAIGHCAYHAGQMMIICRSIVGDEQWHWKTIAPGASREFTASMRKRFPHDAS